ncbi:MAG: metallophosphoesterase family protein [Planctomycetota bacterium]|jgi:predicted phosphodiesterase
MGKEDTELSNRATSGGVANRVGIIQLSDLQFGENHRFGYPSKIGETLLSDIKEMSREYDFTPVYIVLSGDITEKADSEEFNDAVNVIEEIVNGLHVDRRNILCVPGNHDVNWKESRTGNEIGDNQLKFHPYNEFVANITQTDQRIGGVTYPLIKADEWNIEFVLVNSCEKIDPENTYAWICKEKVKGSLASKKEEGSLRIVIAHHSLHAAAENEFRQVMNDTEDSVIPKQLLQKRLKAIDNMKEVISLIQYHKCDIVLTGHTHVARIEAPTDDEGHPIIYSGCGSTGGNKDKREDGIQNQYSIHVIDCETFKFQSIWRAYNPSTRTESGKGGWIEDGSFRTNPTKYCLAAIKRKMIGTPLSSMAERVSQLTDSGAEEKPKDVSIKPSGIVAMNLYKMKSAIACLLGGWHEKS